MKRINLRDYYPFYLHDYFIDVEDIIAETIRAYDLHEKSYKLREYRHKAYFSLDRDDGIDRGIVFISITPYEIYEKKVSNEELYSAFNHLSGKQAKRIYAYYYLGLSKAEIAKSEGVGESCIRESIKRGLKNLGTMLNNFH